MPFGFVVFLQHTIAHILLLHITLSTLHHHPALHLSLLHLFLFLTIFYCFNESLIAARKTVAPVVLPQKDVAESSEDDDVSQELVLEELVGLEDLQELVEDLLDEQEQDEEDEGRFQVFLRLSPIPEYLVKGYDFKMLNKYFLNTPPPNP